MYIDVALYTIDKNCFWLQVNMHLVLFQQMLEYSVSFNDGSYLIEAVDSDKRVVEGHKGEEDYLMLETDSSLSDDKGYIVNILDWWLQFDIMLSLLYLIP